MAVERREEQKVKGQGRVEERMVVQHAEEYQTALLLTREARGVDGMSVDGGGEDDGDEGDHRPLLQKV